MSIMGTQANYQKNSTNCQRIICYGSALRLRGLAILLSAENKALKKMVRYILYCISLTTYYIVELWRSRLPIIPVQFGTFETR